MSATELVPLSVIAGVERERDAPRLCLCGCGQIAEAFMCDGRTVGRGSIWFAKGHMPACWRTGCKRPPHALLVQLERIPRTQLGLLCRRALLTQFPLFSAYWTVLDIDPDTVARSMPPKMPATSSAPASSVFTLHVKGGAA